MKHVHRLGILTIIVSCIILCLLKSVRNKLQFIQGERLKVENIHYILLKKQAYFVMETTFHQWNMSEHLQDPKVYNYNFNNSMDIGYLSYIRQVWISPQKQLHMVRNLTSKLKSTERIKHTLDYSEAGQSLFVIDVLNNKSNGVFVESGAADGESSSNTLFLENQLGWSGLLIEPNPTLYEKLQLKKRTSYISNACLNTRTYSQQRTFAELETWSRLAKTNDTRRLLRKARISTVQCFPLEALLNSLAITYIDYLSLDTEGSELNILRTIPMDQYFIDIIGVEYRVTIGTPVAPFIDFERTLTKLEALRTFFRETGMYTEIGILPLSNQDSRQTEMYGLDVFFRRK